jgi:hypothetical protein
MSRVKTIVMKERRAVRVNRCALQIPKIVQNRRANGFSIATVLCIGVVSCLWMFGTASLVIPAAGRVTRERVADLTRSSAEAGLDWAVTQLNDPSRRATIDHQTVAIPSSVLALNTLSGSVTVADYPAPVSSYLYDQTCDWNHSTWNGQATTTCNNVYGGNGWRLLTATVNAGSANSRQVRVILKPVYSATTQSSYIAGSPQPFFGTALSSGQGVLVGGGLSTDSYTSSVGNPQPSSGFDTQDASIISNGVAAIGGSSVIGGDVSSYSSDDAAVVLGNNASVLHNVVTNGAAQGNMSAIQGSYSAHAGCPTANFPPSPTAPANATPVTLALASNDTVTLTTGAYVTSTISISDNARLCIDSSQGPVDVYVNGSGSSTGITIGGNGIAHSGRPVNFRIWYAGSGNVQIGGSNSVVGTIYAPNAPVKLNGSGDVYGGIIGSTLTISGSTHLHFDKALQNQGPMYFPPMVVNKPADTINYFQAVSWHEY